MSKKKGVGGVLKKIFKAIGIILLIAVIGLAIAYFASPDVKDFINTSWSDLKYQIKR